MLRKETGKEVRCWKRSQGWDQTGRVGSQHERVGRSDVVGSGPERLLNQGVSIFFRKSEE